jgi:hypothetical protein
LSTYSPYPIPRYIPPNIKIENDGRVTIPDDRDEPIDTTVSWYDNNRYVGNAGINESHNDRRPDMPTINPRNIVMGIVPSMSTLTGNATRDKRPLLYSRYGTTVHCVATVVQVISRNPNRSGIR